MRTNFLNNKSQINAHKEIRLWGSRATSKEFQVSTVGNSYYWVAFRKKISCFQIFYRGVEIISLNKTVRKRKNKIFTSCVESVSALAQLESYLERDAKERAMIPIAALSIVLAVAISTHSFGISFFCFSYIYSFEILHRALDFLGECVAHCVSGWSVCPGDSEWGSLGVRWEDCGFNFSTTTNQPWEDRQDAISPPSTFLFY